MAENNGLLRPVKRREFFLISAVAAALKAQNTPRRHRESIATISRQPEYPMAGLMWNGTDW